ncbi:hypothetical protein [Diaphorobacter nitroreducens]|uniref:hypothetical protein n=1 Tax=Diaphorobacter nitroreducens TaxID=164759 RepID=UPI0028AEA0FD|nr:hypothetical protein [Diaphorobacter nitroreducens]
MSPGAKRSQILLSAATLELRFMSDQKHTFAAPVKAPDCWDWIRPEDVVRHALAAFYWACNSVKAPKGERFLALDGRPYADRETFADCMTHFFDLRIKAEAYALGIGDYAPEARMLERCSLPNQR